jgi:UDP-N-acetylglucosamine--N-acetylmuramyl-(pentapeptide) pyrophosphoryl-undecaprenol N-acetylglucosamine transferase
VHEPGAVAGLTSRTLALVADRVIVGMEGAFERAVKGNLASRLPKPKHPLWLGTPVREEIAGLASPNALRRARREASPPRGRRKPRRPDAERPRARGAEGDAGRIAPEVVHQAGENTTQGCVPRTSPPASPRSVPFVDDMAARYAWCDVLVCRAGAITVAEVSAAGIAAILFPLPWFVQDEQAANAHFLAHATPASRLPS